jgi:GTP-binding protein EngB required for normal cell division
MASKSISIKENVWELAKKKYPNQLSPKIQRFLENLINEDQEDNLDKQILKIEKEELINKISQLSAKLDNINNKLDKIKEKENEKEKQLLLNEKEREEAAYKCIICNTINPDEKFHKFEKGLVCNNCFLSSDPNQLKKYTGGK